MHRSAYRAQSYWMKNTFNYPPPTTPPHPTTKTLKKSKVNISNNVPVSLVFLPSNLLIEQGTHPLTLICSRTSARKLDCDKKLYETISGGGKEVGEYRIYKFLLLNIYILELRTCLKFENYFAKGCWKLSSACRDYPLESRYLINSAQREGCLWIKYNSITG